MGLNENIGSTQITSQTGVTPTLENTLVGDNQSSSQEMPKLMGPQQPLNKLQNRSIIGHRYSNVATQNFNNGSQSLVQNNQRVSSQNNGVQKNSSMDRSQTNRGTKGTLLASDRYKMNQSSQNGGNQVTRYMSNLHQTQLPSTVVPPINGCQNGTTRNENGVKRRNGSNIPINIRNKS